MAVTNHIAAANLAAAAYLFSDKTDSAERARLQLRIGMLESGIRELQHLLAGPDAKGALTALECVVWGVTVTLHVESTEAGPVWQEAWIGSTDVGEWIHALPEDKVDEAMRAAWDAHLRAKADGYWSDRAAELAEAA